MDIELRSTKGIELEFLLQIFISEASELTKHYRAPPLFVKLINHPLT